jgi:hypothetical protein
VVTGAFGDCVPHRDLLLSPDHAVFVDGVLIPIRYLVNGRSIRQETCDRISYWHVELDRHGVMLAEGLPAESYLDTGNRAAFANGGALVALHPDFALGIWESQACAPLVRDGAGRVAARARLLRNAAALGHVLEADPDLCLRLGDDIVRPGHSDTMSRFANIPAGKISLISRTMIPAHVLPESDDHRRLGVAVARIICDGNEISLDDHRLGAGWHAREVGSHVQPWRWTDGQAELRISACRKLDIALCMAGPYWRDDPVPVVESPRAASNQATIRRTSARL